ncbi:hypothetical protein [Streptomyces sp. NPDC048606]|uniref:hypothetical protein n=1 Tax=Streptomyces sp. NPDC048606 TaxID=3154726 RepID=UPI00343259F8
MSGTHRPCGTSYGSPTPGTAGPDLLQAVIDGYGRPLTPEEEAQLTVSSVLDAVSDISYGTAHGDPELVERDQRTLARLRTEQHP